MLMVYNLLLFIIMHCICKVSTELFVPGLEEVSPFTDMAQEHDTFCARVSHDCSMRTGPEVESYCCGTCTCDSFCHAHGSCCLSAYGSFEQARISVQKSR